MLPIINKKDMVKSYIEIIDGLLLTGGCDISPLLYREEPGPFVGDISKIRDIMELELFKRAQKAHVPVLGICRGVQLINIALGGTLYQDIAQDLNSPIGHIYKNNLSEEHHTIDLVPETKLFDIYKKPYIGVSSVHHQAIKDLGNNLLIAGRSRDGIIEAIELRNNKNIIGVQYHLEDLINNQENHIGVFEYFINQCSINS